MNAFIVIIMSHKNSISSSKITLCDRYNRHLRVTQRVSGDRVIHRPNLLKRVLSSKNIGAASPDKNSCSAGIIQAKSSERAKKITKSDCILDANISTVKIDYCKTCGDTTTTRPDYEKLSDIYSVASLNRIIHPKNFHNETQNGLHQHYINKNFQQSTESVHDYNQKKVSLDTINEQSESINESEDEVFKVYKDFSSEELGFFNVNNGIENIKQFRNENFFECHSVKSRLEHNIGKHKCVYRFYLNERLFPVPLNTDVNESIRCMECNLPWQNKQDVSVNGMIQAKVKLNNKVQDMLVMLPVKEHLIIRERKKEIKSKKDLDSVYFGIIKLNLNGDSVFNRTRPDDSLALKYQKGYRKFVDELNYDYTSNNDDIVII